MNAVNETMPTHKARDTKSRLPLSSEGVLSWLSAAVFCVGVTFAPRQARYRKATRAAKYPLMPCTPPPGGVDEEQM